MSDPSLNVWIARVNGLREKDELLARGRWTAYKEAESLRASNDPMKGEFILVRWRIPNVAISHYDPEFLVGLARTIEGALE